MRLAVLEPTGNGLSAQEQWVLSQVQGSITADFNRFSAITIIDRQNIEKILAEQTQSLSGNYSEQDYVRLGNLTNARLILAGTIRKTANNYMLELAVTDAESGERRASYPPKAVSLIALENNSAAREAAADILKQLGVNLTAAALQELKTVENNTAKIQAENALARGIVAQRQGTEVAALSYFFQAAAFDPTLAEAANRSSVLAANISSGNIGEDARNEIAWRRNWVARLTETEQYFNNYFDNFFRTASLPYTLIYSTEIMEGEINFQNETITLSIETRLRASLAWPKSVEPVLQSMQSVINAVHDGLTATGRAAVWGLDKWPQQGGFNLRPFGTQTKNFTVVFELVNSRNQVIGRQTLQTSGSYTITAPMPGARTTVSVSAEVVEKTVTFAGVKADNITDNLTIRVASVNGVNAETAARNGVLQIGTPKVVSDYVLEGETITEYRGNSGVALVIPESLDGRPITAIESGVFRGFQLTSVTIGNSVISIGDSAFAGNQLTSVTFPNSVISIGEAAFARNQLTSVTIGNSVVNIGSGAFAGNPLTNITVSSGNTAYIAKDYFLLSKDEKQLLAYYGYSKSVTIPNRVTSIEGRTFIGGQLISVTIPNSVISIGEDAFARNQLTSVTIGSNVAFGSSVFDNNFESAYNARGKAAGTYTRSGNVVGYGSLWSYSPR
jgi:TolB-like protein